MNKADFITEYTKKGWKVAPATDWTFVENRDIKGRAVKVYDVPFVDPKGMGGQAQVVVHNEGATNEDGEVIENVKPLGQIKDALIPFELGLRRWLDEKEASMNTVFAITVEKINALDEVAEVMVYTNSANDVQKALYVVRRRGQLFSFKKIV